MGGKWHTAMGLFYQFQGAIFLFPQGKALFVTLSDSPCLQEWHGTFYGWLS